MPRNLTAREQCRRIAGVLDSGNLPLIQQVCRDQEQFMRLHRAEIWNARAAQQAKRTRVVVEIDDADDVDEVEDACAPADLDQEEDDEPDETGDEEDDKDADDDAKGETNDECDEDSDECDDDDEDSPL